MINAMDLIYCDTFERWPFFFAFARTLSVRLALDIVDSDIVAVVLVLGF